MDLPAIIWSAIDASIVAFMQGIAAVTAVVVEAHSAADDRGQGLLPIMRAQLRHIYGVTGGEDPPPSRGRRN